MLAAWVRRNCRQLVSVCRRGAGGTRWRFRIRRGADAVAECEQLALESLVSPARVLPCHPHHQSGDGVVDRWSSGPVGVGPSSADEAAMPAQDRVRGDQAVATQRPGQPPDERGEHGRSAQSKRGRGLVRRRMATSWRSTRSSMSFVADVRPISRTNPSTRQKIKYTKPRRHVGIMSDQQSPLVSDPAPSSGTPQAPLVFRSSG